MARSKIILLLAFLAFTSSGCSKFKVGKDFNPQATQNKSSDLDDLFKSGAPSGPAPSAPDSDKNEQGKALNWNQSGAGDTANITKDDPAAAAETGVVSPEADEISDNPQSSSLAGITDPQTTIATNTVATTPDSTKESTTTTTVTTTDGKNTNTTTTTQPTAAPAKSDHTAPFASGSNTPATAGSTAGLVTTDPTGTGANSGAAQPKTTATKTAATPATTATPSAGANNSATGKTAATSKAVTPAAAKNTTSAAEKIVTPANQNSTKPTTTATATEKAADKTADKNTDSTGKVTGTAASAVNTANSSKTASGSTVGVGAGTGTAAGVSIGASKTTTQTAANSTTKTSTQNNPAGTESAQGTSSGGIATITTNNLKNVPVDNKLGGGTIGTSNPEGADAKQTAPAVQANSPVITSTSKVTTQTNTNPTLENNADNLTLKTAQGESLRTNILWTLISETEQFLKHIQTVKPPQYPIASRKLEMSAVQMCRIEDNKPLQTIFDPKISNTTLEASRYMNTASPLRDRIFQLKRADIQPGQDLNSSANSGLAGEKDMMGYMTHLTMDLVGQTANIVKVTEAQTLESYSQLLNCMSNKNYSSNCLKTDEMIKELEYLNSAKRILKSMSALSSGTDRKCEELNFSLISKILIEKKNSNTIFNEMMPTFGKSFSCFGNARLSGEAGLNSNEQTELIRLYSYKLLYEAQKYKTVSTDKTVLLSLDKMSAMRTSITAQAKRAFVYMTMVSPYLRFSKSETFRTPAGLKDLKQALEKTQKELLNWSRKRSNENTLIYSYKSAIFSAVKGGPKALRGDLCVISEMVLKNTQRDVSLNQFDEVKNGTWLGFDRSSALIPLNLATQAIQMSISLTGPLLINHEKLGSVVNGCYDLTKKSSGVVDACYQLKGYSIQGTPAVRQQFMFKLLGISQ